MRNVLLVAELTLREAARKRLVVTLLILTALFVGFYLYGAHLLQVQLTTRASDLGFDRPLRSASYTYATTALFGMYLVNFLASLMAVLSTVGSISGDIESGVMQSVAYKPVRRAELVAGRWLGFAVVNAAYIVLLSVTLLVGFNLITGYTPPAAAPAIGLMLLGMLLLLTLTVLGSTVFSTLANGIGVFLLYGVGFAGGIMQSIGSFTNTPLLTRLAGYTTVVMPADSLWKGASYHLQPEQLLTFQRFSNGANPFLGTEPISPALLTWAVVYVALALGAALWSFSRRDL